MKRSIVALALSTTVTAACSDASLFGDMPGASDGGGATDDGEPLTGAAGTGDFDDDTGGLDETGGGDPDVGPELATDCLDDEIAIGLACLSCVPAGDSFDVMVERVAIAVRVQIDAELAPPVDSEDGYLSLRSFGSGDAVVLGNSHDQMLEAMVLPGTYDVVWSRESGGSIVPKNSAGIVGRITVASDGWVTVADPAVGSGLSVIEYVAGTLVVDLRPVQMSGEFRYNGVATPAAALERGLVYLLDPATGDEVVLGKTHDVTYTARVLPGTYEVHYAVEQSSGLSPVNADAYVTTITVYQDEIPDEVNIDIPVVQLAGDFRINGATPPGAMLESGQVRLRDTMTGDEIALGSTAAAQFATPIVAGTYDIVYSFVAGSATVPRNTAAILDQVALQGASQNLTIDITTTTVSGAFSIDGLPPPNDPANVGELMLRGVDSEDEIALGTTTAGSYSTIVIPGSYDVFYAQKTASGAVPINTNARIGSATITGATTLDIDVPVTSVSGAVTVDGAIPPTSEYDDGRIYLRNVQTGDSVLLGNTRLGEIGGLVVPGDYDVYYEVESAGQIVPQNAAARIDWVTIPTDAPVALAIDVPVTRLQGAITIAGGPPPVSDAERANLFLQDLATDETLFLAPVSAGGFALPLTSGTYLLWYDVVETTGLLPQNTHAVLGCLELTP